MGNIDAQDLNEFLLHAQPIHILDFIPLLEGDDEVEAFVFANGFYPEHLRHVDDADAAHFHVVAREFRAGAKHFAPVHQHRFHHIVRH